MAKLGTPGSTPAWVSATAMVPLYLLCAQLPQATSVITSPPKTKTPSTTPGIQCGKPGIIGKIINGEDASEDRWPWQASVLYRHRHVCGGSLIDKFWVITAAHCLKKSHKPEDYKVLLGYSKLEEPSSNSRIIRVNKVIVHKEYNKDYYMVNDIALLQMRLKVPFNPHIFPVCVPTTELNINEKSDCWITGWGKLSEQSHLKAPYQLQEAQISVLERRICEIHIKSPIKKLKVNYNNLLCGGGLDSGKSICKGDSGGPLVCDIDDTWYLIGISSWGFECNKPVSPTAFTKVWGYRNWISIVNSSTFEPADYGDEVEEAPSLSNYTVSSQNCLALRAKSKIIILLVVFLLTCDKLLPLLDLLLQSVSVLRASTLSANLSPR